MKESSIYVSIKTYQNIKTEHEKDMHSGMVAVLMCKVVFAVQVSLCAIVEEISRKLCFATESAVSSQGIRILTQAVLTTIPVKMTSDVKSNGHKSNVCK